MTAPMTDYTHRMPEDEEREEYALTFGNRQEIVPADLPPQVLDAPRTSGVGAEKGVAAQNLQNAASLKAFLREKEKEYLEQVLEKAGGDKEAAAKKLNISLATLYRKLPGAKE